MGQRYRQTRRWLRTRDMQHVQHDHKRNHDTPIRWEIHHGDCLELLPRLPLARVIFADPPYNIGVDYGLGATTYKLPQAQYLAWCAKWMQACANRLMDDGSLTPFRELPSLRPCFHGQASAKRIVDSRPIGRDARACAPQQLEGRGALC